MQLTEDQLADLITAVLAVNGYSLEKAASLMPAFKDRGLLDPNQVLKMKGNEIIQAIKDAGYDRGGYVNVIALRIPPLMVAVRAGELDCLRSAATLGDKGSFIAILSKLYGFGPRTSITAWMLWTGTGTGTGTGS